MSESLLPRFDLVHPDKIKINRDDRQRREIKTDDGLLKSIDQHGVIVPIIVRLTEEGLILVAGERRLECCKQLGYMIPVRYWDTLSPLESSVIELEENIKRSDLPWRDYAKAIQKIHQLKQQENSLWNQQDTAKLLSVSDIVITRALFVARAIDDGNQRIDKAGSIHEAYLILARISERKTAQIVQELIDADDETEEETEEIQTVIDSQTNIPVGIIVTSTTDFNNHLTGSHSEPKPIITTPPKSIPPIIVADFLQWAPAYTGPKFNVIHCDFPYGVEITTDRNQGLTEVYPNTAEIYWDLTNCLISNLDRIASYSCHVIFWFSMTHYTKTVETLESSGLSVIRHPLIWFKSDGRATMGGSNAPRHAYEAALLCSRNRDLLVLERNCYAAPIVYNSKQPTQKPEAMLRFFLRMVVDEHTDFFDPTAGSGSSLRAAEDLKAKSVLGLEINPEYAAAANIETERARGKRILNQRVTETGP